MQFHERFYRTSDGATPSESLNHAFTYLVESLDNRINENGWLNSFKDLQFSPNQKATIQDFNYEKYEVNNNKRVDQFPSIYQATGLKVVSDDYSDSVPFKSPIGDYGVDWSRRLVLAATTILDATINPESKVNILDEFEKINRYYAPDLKKYTFRRDGAPSIFIAGPSATFAEAIQSTLMVTNLFSHHRIDDFENPEDLTATLINQGLYSRLALLISPNEVGEMMHNGTIFTKPAIVKDNDGNYDLRNDISTHLAENHQPQQLDRRLDRGGCPVGRRIPGNNFSGVDLLASLFHSVVLAQTEQYTANKPFFAKLR